jgi:hypothetical protein
MMIALVRRGTSDQPQFLEWLRAAGHETIDVSRKEDLFVGHLSSCGRIDCCLGTIPLKSLGAVIYLGAPGAYGLPPSADRETIYLHSERNAALLCALWSSRDLRVVNPGFVFGWNRLLHEPVVLRRELAGAGWRIPLTEEIFRLQQTPTYIAVSKKGVAASYGRFQLPEPSRTVRRLLVVSRSSHPCWADSPDQSLLPKLECLAQPTIGLLESLGYDWATIAVGESAGEFYAYGMRPDLPSGLAAEAAAKVINGALAAPITADLSVSRSSMYE